MRPVPDSIAAGGRPGEHVFRTDPGRRVYGVSIGILLQDCNVPFLPGDVANATSYDYPVLFETVEGASTQTVVHEGAALEEAFIAAARRLERDGVRAITGDCGYMIRYQHAVADAVSVPVFLSSLLQLPTLLTMGGPRSKVGVLVASGAAADTALLRLAGVPDSAQDRVVVAGLEHCPHFRSGVLDDTGELDRERLEEEIVGVAVDLVEREPSTKIILLECSNIPPYAAAIRRATGRLVFDYIGFIDYVHRATVARGFSGLY
jgi:hypothetical protein